MRFWLDASTYNTSASTLLQEHFLRQPSQHCATIRTTIGFERLYKSRNTGELWLHERFYANGGGPQDSAIPLSKDEARAWLRDRFGWMKSFSMLEEGGFHEASSSSTTTAAASPE
jgi:hypothetical protein